MSITGHNDFNIANTLIKQDANSKGLAILFPGAGYRSTMPLLHYPERLLHWLGFDVLRIDHSPYLDIPEFQKLNSEEQISWLYADATHIGNAALENYGNNGQPIILLGKSIGTLALGHLVTNHTDFKQALCIWLTPLLKSDTLVKQLKSCSNPSLFVIGSSDHHYKADLLNSICEAENKTSLVLDNADHSLMVDQDMTRSLNTLQTTMSGIEDFLVSQLIT